MARKNGCPTSVRDWVVEILSRTSTVSDPEWIRVKGLTGITVSHEAETEDGSAADSIHGEPYVIKRSGSIKLEGRPVVDRLSGARDRGQEELDYYLSVAGCDGDARLRIVDNCGHAQIWDVIVVGKESDSDDSSETVTWELERVGEPEEELYVQVQGVRTEPAEALTLKVGETRGVAVKFAPGNASNQKFSVASADTSRVKVAHVDGLNFDIVGVALTLDPITVQVRSMNNAKTATVAVTVEDADG